MATKKDLEREVNELRERVAVLEAALAAQRPTHEFIIVNPPGHHNMQQWWQFPVTCGVGVNSVLATAN